MNKKRTAVFFLIISLGLFSLFAPGAYADVIIDNGDPGTSYTGSWSSSGAPNPYGASSLWSYTSSVGGIAPTYTWSAVLPQAGTYDVYAWWTSYVGSTTRSTSAPYTITYSGGSQTVSVNQRINGGQWNKLGTFTFGTSGKVTLTASDVYPIVESADAVKFTPVSAATHTITATAGVGGSISPSGSVAVADMADRMFNIQPNAGYHISDVKVDGSSVGAVSSYTFTQVASDHTIEASFEALPQIFHTITATSSGNGSILPSGAVAVENGSSQTFVMTPDASHHVADVRVDGASVGSPASYTFTNVISDHTIEATFEADSPTNDLIIDNGDPGTSFTGQWLVSSGPDPYGANSLWAREGPTYTWTFSPDVSGTHKLFMWWTVLTSRSSEIPVDIEHWDGTDRVYVNQQKNGGIWNSLGSYPFAAGHNYKITITPPPGSSTTCADAVKMVQVMGNIAPVVTAMSVSPNPALPGQGVTFSGAGDDADGFIQAYSWYSTLDGPLSTEPSFSTTALSEGVHTIFFKVQDDKGAWSPEVSVSVDVNNRNVQTTEHIYFATGYASMNAMPVMISTLQDMGATLSNGVWTYVNKTRNKRYLIHPVENAQELTAALKTEGAHVMYFGHSNYGLGQVFATDTEFIRQVINDIYYIDDDRILNTSSPWISVSVSGMRTGQAYPFWWPIFKDGTDGIMPYDFGDPRGDPPYNYYPTYQVPGDPTYYKIETVRESAIERFPDSYSPAWYSPSGGKPDPSNPEDLQYFITNSSLWTPSLEVSGNWLESQSDPGYFKENYLYIGAGQGNNYVKWMFTIPTAGNYGIYAWWPASSGRATNAPYTVNHGAGSTTLLINQRVNGNRWNKLGDFYFDAGDYSVVLTDKAVGGTVAADAIMVGHPDNPPQVVQADFYASPLSGTAPLKNVRFVNQGTGDLTGRLWTFGDGEQNGTRDDIEHTYLAPGQYTVSLTVTGPAGSNTRTKTGYITVGVGYPVLRAEFTGSSREGELPRSVRFRDRSSGYIVSWAWDFGDGATSSEKSPTHIYTTPGNYRVSLTVTDSDGNTSTETKEKFVRVTVYEKIVDNVDYPKRHYGSKTILFRKDLEVSKEDLKYSRLFYGGCDSGHYYTDTFNRGIFFYANNSTGEGEVAMSEYLKAYVGGKSDYEIWRIIQDIEPLYDYYDFRKTPSKQW